MYLYFNAQDFNKLVLGFFDKKIKLKKFETEPNLFLQTITNFFDTNKVDFQKVKGIAIVTGPGSFTALRSILSIVNTILLVQKIKVIEIKNETDLDDEKLFNQAVVKFKKGIGSTKFIRPHYNKEPNISFAKSKF